MAEKSPHKAKLEAILSEEAESARHIPDLKPLVRQMLKLRFRKKLFGGVDEMDVWKQMENIEQTFQSILDAQAAYYQALLDDKKLQQDESADVGGVFDA